MNWVKLGFCGVRDGGREGEGGHRDCFLGLAGVHMKNKGSNLWRQ